MIFYRIVLSILMVNTYLMRVYMAICSILAGDDEGIIVSEDKQLPPQHLTTLSCLIQSSVCQLCQVNNNVIRKLALTYSRPTCMHMCMCISSTFSGFVSFVYENVGSIYIDKFVEVFSRESHNKEISTLLIKVSLNCRFIRQKYVIYT